MAQLMISLGDRNLKDCSYESLYNAAHFCATLALLPSLGQIALIPRNIKKKNSDEILFTVCAPMPQWQGYKAIMERHPDVLEVNAKLVHIRDEIEVYRDDRTGCEIVHHKRDPFDTERKFGSWKDVRGGYLEVVYVDRNRPNKYNFTTAEHMQKSAQCAETQKLWKAWFEQMCLKTVYRDGFARRVVTIDAVTSGQLKQLTEADDTALGNDPMRGVEAPQPAPTAIPQSRAAQLAHRVNDQNTFEGSATNREPVEPEFPNDADQEPETEQEPEGQPQPAVSKHLEKLVPGLLDCKTAEQIAVYINGHVTDPDDFDELSAVGDWMIDQGIATAKQSGKRQGSII